MSKASFWQRGETIDHKNATTEVIEANTVLVIGKRIGVAGMSIKPGEIGSLHVTGVFEFDKTAAEEVALGADVYFDEATGAMTTTASSNVKAGFAVETAAAAGAHVLVKINA